MCQAKNQAMSRLTNVSVFILLVLLCTCIHLMYINMENRTMLHVIPESFINMHQGRGQNNASLEHTWKQETASTEATAEKNDVNTSFTMDQLIEQGSNLVKYREPLFEKRRRHIHQACTRYYKQQSVTMRPLQGLSSYLSIAAKHKTIYCGIPKTGSTFWKKTLKIIENGGNFSSLYEYRNSDTKLKKALVKPEKMFKGKTELFQRFQEEALSFMFVREPYGRIFSAYNNKILHPNTIYWTHIGRKVIKSVRENPSLDSLKYGHDVTFPEMIKFLVTRNENGQVIDKHWSPMFKMCDPCKFTYDYIGKMESFADDAHFLIAKLRQKYRDIYIDFGDADTESALDTAQGHVRFLYLILNRTKDLDYPKYNFFLRTWRDLQIRGYLSKYIDMPIRREQVSQINSDEFFTLIKEALETPMNRTLVRLQRQEAMIQAYQQVPLADMRRLSKFVEMDCMLFGYDPTPVELFQRNSDSNSNMFNYFDTI